MSDKKNRLRFSYEDDVVLLREFLNVNPMLNPQGWGEIQEHVFIISKKNFQIRTLKNHVMHLIEIFLRKIKDEQIRSGVEEAYSERDQLLQEVSSLCKDAKYSFKQPRKKTGLTKEQQLCELGKEVRENYAAGYYAERDAEEDDLNFLNLPLNENPQPEPQQHMEDHDYSYIVHDAPLDSLGLEETIYINENILENSTPNIPLTTPEPVSASIPNIIKEGSEATKNKTARNVLVPTKRRLKPREPIRKNALAYLSEKSEKENINKTKELELEEKKLAIEEKRIKLEERKLILEEKRFEFESKERIETLNIQKQKAEIEIHEKRITQQLLESQQQLISKLLEKEAV